MKCWHLVLRRTVLSLLTVIIMHLAGNCYARMELMRELNNVDGDPGDGSDSFGSGSSNYEYFPKQTDTVQEFVFQTQTIIWMPVITNPTWLVDTQFNFSLIVRPITIHHKEAIR